MSEREKKRQENSLFKLVMMARKKIDTGDIMPPEKAIERLRADRK